MVTHELPCSGLQPPICRLSRRVTLLSSFIPALGWFGFNGHRFFRQPVSVIEVNGESL